LLTVESDTIWGGGGWGGGLKISVEVKVDTAISGQYSHLVHPLHDANFTALLTHSVS